MKNENNNMTKLVVLCRKEISDDFIIISDKEKNYIEGDIVKVVRYSNETILNLCIKKSSDIEYGTGLISPNNSSKLGLDFDNDIISIFKPNN